MNKLGTHRARLGKVIGWNIGAGIEYLETTGAQHRVYRVVADVVDIALRCSNASKWAADTEAPTATPQGRGRP
jgi:hypothetical protein